VRSIAALFAVCLLASPTLFAQSNPEAESQVEVSQGGRSSAEGLTLSDRSLVKESFRSGATILDVYAGDSIDVRALLKAAKVGKDESAQTIHDKIDTARQRLYPNEPLVIEVTPPFSSRVSTGAALVKGYYGWNYAGSWWAYWASTTAVMFLDDIRGAYNVYDCYPCGNWVFRGTYRSGGSATRYNYGGYIYRGFSLSRGSGSQMDFAMYFFR